MSRLYRLAVLAQLVVVAALSGLAPASAQRGSTYERPPYNTPQASGPSRREGVAGQFDYYALVLSWSPSYCAGLVRNDYDPQCNRRDGKRYSFILHGLWPQFEKGYPEYCQTRDRPFVPQSTIDRMQDIMPSPRLTIHEYKKHGTCTGLGPDGYYDMSRKLFGKIAIPPRYTNTQEPFFVSPGELEKEFMAANPALKPDAFSVVCGGPGNRLREIRVCFSREGEFRACGNNENQNRLCRADRMYVPPVRSGAGGSDGSVPQAPGQRLAPGERRL